MNHYRKMRALEQDLVRFRAEYPDAKDFIAEFEARIARERVEAERAARLAETERAAAQPRGMTRNNSFVFF